MKKIESENILLRRFQTEDAEEAFENWAGRDSRFIRL